MGVARYTQFAQHWLHFCQNVSRGPITAVFDRTIEMKKLLLALMAWGFLLTQTVAAGDSLLRPDHPDEYIVKKGDTLWDISGRFLEKPWLWPEIWHANPQVENPHLIYPGDRLSLVYLDGRPQLVLNRGGEGVVRLSPEVRSTALDEAIPAIPLEDINAFLSRSRIVDPEELEAAPYVLSGAAGHLVVGAGDKLHARGELPAGERSFGIFRGGDLYVDPVTREVLGKSAVEMGSSKLIETEGDIATLAVNTSNEEIRVGDRLLPMVEQKIRATFYPSAPDVDISGVIIAVEGGITQIGHLDVVVINRGSREGIKDGNVLAISATGQIVADPIAKKKVKLPDTRAGLLMIFRTFDKLSYGLVLSATQPLKVMDKVGNP